MHSRRQSTTVSRYISSFSPSVRAKLKQLRQAISEAAPDAHELISYGMPAFKQNRVLVYFAALTNHVGFYPTSSGVAAFKKELKPYKHSKGAIQFPLDKPIPIGLLKRIVRFRVREETG